MGRLRYALGLLLVAASACSELDAGPDFEDNLVISSGTFFNMCIGYCSTELVVDSTTVTFAVTSPDTIHYPRLTRSATLSRAEWQRIRALAKPAAFSSVAGVHGCPGCADGGAEWVEIRTSESSIRATFDYGRVLDPISDLQSEVRALRQMF